mgnify:CR=1 FL=1
MNKHYRWFVLLTAIAMMAVFAMTISAPSVRAAGISGTPTGIAQVHSTATPQADGGLTHIVQPGQVLINIATSYGITLEELLQLNNLEATDIINPGDVLIIKKAPEPLALTETAIALTGTPTPMPTSTPMPATPQALGTEDSSVAGVKTGGSIASEAGDKAPNVLSRIVNSDAKYLALGVILLILLGLLLLVISSRRMRE